MWPCAPVGRVCVFGYPAGLLSPSPADPPYSYGPALDSSEARLRPAQADALVTVSREPSSHPPPPPPPLDTTASAALPLPSRNLGRSVQALPAGRHRPSSGVARRQIENIAAARVAADGGQNAGAALIRDSRLKAVEQSAPGAAGNDPTCEAIKEELRDLSARVGDPTEYQKTGRACLLAGMSSHAQQRASGMDVQSTCKASAYLTPKMEEMVEVSRESSRKREGGNSWKQPIKLAKVEEEEEV